MPQKIAVLGPQAVVADHAAIISGEVLVEGLGDDSLIDHGAHLVSQVGSLASTTQGSPVGSIGVGILAQRIGVEPLGPSFWMASGAHDGF